MKGAGKVHSSQPQRVYAGPKGSHERDRGAAQRAQPPSSPNNAAPPQAVEAESRLQPAAGDRIMVLRQPWLDMVLDGHKTLEIRGKRARPGWVCWLATRAWSLGASSSRARRRSSPAAEQNTCHQRTCASDTPPSTAWSSQALRACPRPLRTGGRLLGWAGPDPSCWGRRSVIARFCSGPRCFRCEPAAYRTDPGG